MKIVAFSDTHHRSFTLPDLGGDVLVFAGDVMTCGYRSTELKVFIEWMSQQPQPFKIFVAGNHDRVLDGVDKNYWINMMTDKGIIYLEDSGIEIMGFKFWGTPYQPFFYDWAFNRTNSELKEHFGKIPTDTEILITHVPPKGTLDSVNRLIRDLGCPVLKERINHLPNLRAHIFGHIHGAYGKIVHSDWSSHNVAICNEAYRPVNDPHVIELEMKGL
jgi:Icc-related predicted phosphoesterase